MSKRTVAGWQLQAVVGRGWWKHGDWTFEIDEAYPSAWYASHPTLAVKPGHTIGLRRAVKWAQEQEKKSPPMPDTCIECGGTESVSDNTGRCAHCEFYETEMSSAIDDFSAYMS